VTDSQSTRSYFDNIPRLAQSGYSPSDQDILRSRVKSVGIAETVLDISGTMLRLVDVGGQRSERRKWAGVFEGVEVLLFLISISEYNQVLYEDETVSRFSEATTLWSSSSSLPLPRFLKKKKWELMATFTAVANSRWFAKTNVILFLNKIDLFRQVGPLFISLAVFGTDSFLLDRNSLFTRCPNT